MNNPAEVFMARRERNLKFFREHYPHIYTFFADYKMSRYRLNILTETQEVDLVGPEGSLYDNAGQAFAKREMASFKKVFAPGKMLQTVAPVTTEALIHPRFMHKRLKTLVSPYQEEIRKSAYRIEFYPLLVFMGVGLGFQVAELCASEKVQHAIIAEPQPDFFAASLYTVDWEQVCRPFMSTAGRSVRFILGLTGDPENIYPDLWNSLVDYCPAYPTGTMFFTHRGDADCNRIVDRLNGNMMLFLSSWGHYDDEIRQFNNALHAFHQQVPLMPRKVEGAESVPVFIVGNGPSLDGRIETIKALRDSALLVSCGTALRSLLEYGIEPDFHVELESDYVTFRVLDALDHEKLKRLNLIAVSHVCPLIFDLFGQSRIYFKKENCIAQFFGDDQAVVAQGVPTCTNAALALSLNLGFRELYLFGMDFGYHDKQYHHSKASIYQAENKGVLSDIDFVPMEEMEVEGWEGETVITTPIYFSTLRMVERVVEEAGRQETVHVFACSDGARIAGTQWLANAALTERLSQRPASRTGAVLDELFAENARPLPLETVNSRIIFAGSLLKESSAEIARILEQASLSSLWDLSLCCSQINDHMERLEAASPGLYYLIRGTVRLFTFIGLSYAWMMESETVRGAFVKEWKSAFLAALAALPAHFGRVTGKAFTPDDPWIRQSIDDEEVFGVSDEAHAPSPGTY